MVVFRPYFTVTIRGSEGTFCPRYLPVLQVILRPNDRLRRRDGGVSIEVGDVTTHYGEDVHFTGDSAHGHGDVIFGCRVQVLSLDGDDGSSGCRTPRRINAGGFGVLWEQGERVSCWQGNRTTKPSSAAVLEELNTIHVFSFRLFFGEF